MKNIKLIHHFVLVLLICTISSCASVSYMSDHIDETLPVHFETYSTEEHCDENVNRLMGLRIKNSIDLNLTDRGFRRSDNPDIVIQYFIKEEMKTYFTNCNGYDRWNKGRVCEEKVIHYKVGAIVIDFIDASTNTVIWHGAIESSPFDSFKNPNRQINEMVNRLLDKEYFSNKV